MNDIKYKNEIAASFLKGQSFPPASRGCLRTVLSELLAMTEGTGG